MHSITHRSLTGVVHSLLNVFLIICVFALASHPAQAQGYSGMLTWHNDGARTGQNLQETVLTPANVNSSQFGKLIAFPVDGQIVAQPLFVYNVKIPNVGTY